MEKVLKFKVDTGFARINIRIEGRCKDKRILMKEVLAAAQPMSGWLEGSRASRFSLLLQTNSSANGGFVCLKKNSRTVKIYLRLVKIYK